MTLTFPNALWGMLLGLTPILIYFLLRRHRTELPWGASYLLRLTLKSRRKSSIWKQVVVLTVRAIALALMAFLMARAWQPNSAPSSLTPVQPREATHIVALVDDSLSMTASDESGGRQSRLRTALTALMMAQRPGDAFSIIPMREGSRHSGTAGSTTIHNSISDIQVREVFATYVPGEGDVGLHEPLAAAMTRLARTPEAIVQLYVFSDFPRALAAEVTRLDWFAKAAERRQVTVTPVNMAPTDTSAQRNMVINNLYIGSDLVLSGMPVSIHVEATNYADEERGGSFIFSVNGQTISTESEVFTPNERKKFSILHSFPEEAPILLEVTTDQSRLEAHGRRALSLSTSDSVNVWVITEKSEAGAQKLPEEEFLLRAFQQLGDQTGVSFVIAEKNMHDITVDIPTEVDVIWIVASQYALPAAGTQLQRFMRGGGGVVVSIAEDMSINAYNRSFESLLPSPLDRRAFEETDPDSAFVTVSPEATETANPLFLDITGGGGENDISRVRIYNYAITKMRDSTLGTVLRFSNAEPLLAHRAVGRGNFYLMTTSAGISWSSMPVCQAWTPFVARLTHAAMAGRTHRRNILPGERLTLEWSGRRPATHIAPDGTEREAQHLAGVDKQFVVLEDARLRGTHRIVGPDGVELAFTVAGEAPEGDLRTLTPEGRAELERALGADIYPDWKSAVQALGASDAKLEIWPWILIILAGLYLFETWFVRLL